MMYPFKEKNMKDYLNYSMSDDEKLEVKRVFNQMKDERGKFVYRESYKHLFAKNLLAKWLRDQDDVNDWCQVAQFGWRSNYGVFTELPFYETSDIYYFECSDGLKDYKEHDSDRSKALSWFKPNYDKGKILFVPDIVVFHKGTPRLIFEIVHSNPLSNDKIDVMREFFKTGYIEIYEIYADDILCHDSSGIPNYINCRTILKD